MRCEDYPCCGHTDGLPCDWTYTPEAQAFDMAHFGCEHEMGFCEAYDEPEEIEAEDCDHPDTSIDTANWEVECDRCYHYGLLLVRFDWDNQEIDSHVVWAPL